MTPISVVKHGCNEPAEHEVRVQMAEELAVPCHRQREGIWQDTEQQAEK